MKTEALKTDKNDIRRSKLLSLILRHKPQTVGVALDENGWVEVTILLTALKKHGHDINHDDLLRIIKNSEKQRFALSDDGLKIRANQGHSVSVDLNLTPSVPPELLYHGTIENAWKSIQNTGLNKGERHHVHLSVDIISAEKIGQRRGKPVILTILAGEMQRSGCTFYLSANGVWLVDFVPITFIKRIV